MGGKRVLTAIVLIPLIYVIIKYLHPVYFLFVVAAVVLTGQYEFYRFYFREFNKFVLLGLSLGFLLLLTFYNRGESGYINKDAIFNAWESPMIIVSSQNQIEPRGYSKVRELKIEKGDSKIRTLVDKSEQLTREKLDENNIDYSIIELLANKLFCDWINFRE